MFDCKWHCQYLQKQNCYGIYFELRRKLLFCKSLWVNWLPIGLDNFEGLRGNFSNLRHSDRSDSALDTRWLSWLKYSKISEIWQTYYSGYLDGQESQLNSGIAQRLDHLAHDWMILCSYPSQVMRPLWVSAPHISPSSYRSNRSQGKEIGSIR